MSIKYLIIRGRNEQKENVYVLNLITRHLSKVEKISSSAFTRLHQYPSEIAKLAGQPWGSHVCFGSFNHLLYRCLCLMPKIHSVCYSWENCLDKTFSLKWLFEV